MVEELLRWLVGDLRGMHELVDALDFSTLTRVARAVGAGRPHRTASPRQRHGLAGATAQAGRRRGVPAGRSVRSGGAAGEADTLAAASGAWVYLVVMLEFQSAVDPLMALRIRSYVDSFHVEQWRGRRFRSTDRLAPVLRHRALQRDSTVERGVAGHRPA